MEREAERPWWFPELVDDAYLARLREDYPENSHLSDDALRSKYECEAKYGVTWDDLGDAYEQFEPLADAFLAQASELTRLKAEIERLRESLGVIDGKLHRAADYAADSVTMRIDHTNIIERLNDICGDVAAALRNKDQD